MKLRVLAFGMIIVANIAFGGIFFSFGKDSQAQKIVSSNQELSVLSENQNSFFQENQNSSAFYSPIQKTENITVSNDNNRISQNIFFDSHDDCIPPLCGNRVVEVKKLYGPPSPAKKLTASIIDTQKEQKKQDTTFKITKSAAFHEDTVPSLVKLPKGLEFIGFSDFEKNEILEILSQTLQNIPKAHLNHLKHLKIYDEHRPTRGLGGRDTILLYMGGFVREEMMNVLIHEIGHVVDTGLFHGNDILSRTAFYDGNTPLYADDPSINFYEISWKSSESKKSESKALDFVSGYAMENVFEDFSESYVMYVTSGNHFRSLLSSSEKLRQKYNFLKNEVFEGKEFQTGKRSENSYDRVFDATLLKK